MNADVSRFAEREVPERPTTIVELARKCATSILFVVIETLDRHRSRHL
jgi:hypothetical protein